MRKFHFRGDMKQKMRYYLELCCGRLEPYLTSEARDEYQAYLSGLN